MRLKTLLAIVVLTVCMGVSAPTLFAQNLLTNGGFETGDFTGWTTGGNFQFTQVVSGPYPPYNGAQDGHFYVTMGPAGSDGTLSQTLATSPGSQYTITFWLAAVGDNPSDFSVYWNNTQLLSLNDPYTGATWTPYTFVATATGSDTLLFSFRDDPAYMALDNVSVAGVECVHDKPQDGFTLIHNFTGTEQPPSPGLAIDRAGNLYGATGSGGNNGQGLAYKLASSGQDWIFTPLYSFVGSAAGQNPLPAIIGPERALYGTADGGIQNCGNSRNEYCGVVYRLRPSPVICPTALCSWTETVIYSFTGEPDGWKPNGNLVFDRTGKLYGTTLNGGAYGQGAIYELTPSSGGWTEQVIYSFTGGSDGGHPNSLLGTDGNLYGTTSSGGGGGGVIFQLMRTGDSWTETIITSYGDHSRIVSLNQEVSGNFYGIDSYDLYQCYFYCNWNTFGRVFMMSPSHGGWQFSTVYDICWYHGPECDIGDFGHDVFKDLAMDASGNLYATEGGDSVSLGEYHWGNIFQVLPFRDYPSLVGFAGDNFRDIEVGANGKLYGTTGTCGNYGAVWQLTPQH